MVKINRHHIFIFLTILVLVGLMGVATAYTGTGFSHNKTVSDYNSLSLNDILGKYSDTNAHVEATGLCTQVVDGDTIYVEGVGKVRLVGVNTPERGVAGSEASKYLVSKLCLNREVSLDIDNSKPTDRYGRTLAVVIVDGKNLNEILLREGLAEIMYIPPSEFHPSDWAGDNTHVSTGSSSNSHNDDTTTTSGTYIGNSNTHKFHLPSCPSCGRIAERNRVTFSSRDEAINQGFVPCKNCNP